MFTIHRATALSLFLLALTAFASAQVDEVLIDTAILSPRVVSNYLADIAKKSESLDQKLDKRTIKAIGRFKRQEARIKKKLARKDSARAALIFANAPHEYQRLEEKLRVPGSLMEYVPALDTINTSLKFLEGLPSLASDKALQAKLKTTASKVFKVDKRFQQAEYMEQFLKQREAYICKAIGESGFAGELKKLNKQAYYYQEQVREYKSLLKDHKKAAKKALQLLARSKLFQEFMRKNSLLASLFHLPGNSNDPLSSQITLVGLQTRSQVNGLLQQQISAGGSGGQQQFQQNIQAAQSQINSLKDRLNRFGRGSSDDILPDFKPNPYKTKSFLQRLEVGANMQSQKASGFFPVTSDIGFSLGYQVNDKSVVGIGSSYKIGWGRSLQHIKVTHQGAGLRSFIDWKIKGTFWISGGYEMNYRSEFRDINVLRDYDAWQPSGLIGLSKVVSLKTKFFKKTKLQLLWDFLSSQQVPRTQALLFRIGYTF